MGLVSKGDPKLVWILNMEYIEVMILKRDYKSAFSYAKEAFEEAPCTATIQQYVRCLYTLRDWPAILKAVQDLEKTKEWSLRYTFVQLRACMFHIGCALWSQKQMSLFDPLLTRALEAMEENNEWATRPWIVFWIAQFIQKFYEDTSVAAQLCDRMLSPQFKEGLGPERQWAYDTVADPATIILSSIYYEKAVAAHKAGQDPDGWVQKLRARSLADDTDLKTPNVYKLNEFSWKLGIYLRKYGMVPEAEWKACFRDAVLQAIDMLCDEDPFNDVEAYALLATLFMAAGDVMNASAAYATIHTEFSYSSDPDALATLEAINFIGPFLCCNGFCAPLHKEDQIFVYKEVYCCTECWATHFCEKCLSVLKKGDLPFRQCSPEHEFVRLLPVPEESIGVAAKFDKENKNMVVQREWLDARRREWQQ